MRRRLLEFGCSIFIFTAAAFADTTILNAVNAANRIPPGFPGYGVAQGALFAITGTELGPADLLQAGFPLPAGDGLGGVTVQVAVGDTTVNAILVYVSATEIGAILPSSTPIGTGKVTVNNNGATASGPITVVATAFGAFATAYYAGQQQALAFNVTGDGSTVANSLIQPAAPGQTVKLTGTGLGATSIDETQSGGTDVSSLDIKVFVGTKPAVVVSAGRDNCCSGYPDSYPIPAGLAALDVIQFLVPDGVDGCHASVVVQIGNRVSNLTQLALSPDGGACKDINTVDFGDTVTLSGTVKTGNISLTRIANRTTTGTATAEIGTEVGTAVFLQSTVPENSVAIPVSYFGVLANNLNPGACIQGLYRVPVPAPVTTPPPPNPNPPVYLDAGDPINLKNSSIGNVIKPLKKSKDQVYSGSLGSSFNIAGLPASNSLFLEPGTITADNGSGGANIGPFSATLELPKQALKFENIDQIPSVDRSKGVTVRWSGGDPNGFVTILGTSYAQDGTATLISNFACTERNSAGQFTVPSYVTLGLPATTAIGPLTAAGNGTLGIQGYVAKRINIPSVDLAIFSSTVIISKGLVYQ